MPRVRRNRDIQLIHFSFFDLLFGAFGAFIFLMLMHVIRTISLVDIDLQKAFDELIVEKNALSTEMVGYKDKLRNYADIEKEYQEAQNQIKQWEQEKKALADENARSQAMVKSQSDELASLRKFKEEYARKGEAEAELQKENEKLRSDLTAATQRLATLNPTPLKVKTRSFPPTFAGEEVYLPIAVEGGATPYTWEYAGKLPDGLSFDNQNGVIKGQTTKAGDYRFMVKVADAAGNSATSSGDLSMRVVNRPVDQKAGVSPGFVLVSIIATIMLIYILIKRFKVHLYLKKMRAEGWEPRMVKIRDGIE
jgi:hypothetical protein